VPDSVNQQEQAEARRF